VAAFRSRLQPQPDEAGSLSALAYSSSLVPFKAPLIPVSLTSSGTKSWIHCCDKHEGCREGRRNRDVNDVFTIINSHSDVTLPILPNINATLGEKRIPDGSESVRNTANCSQICNSQSIQDPQESIRLRTSPANCSIKST
jgi:hypothetical protein